VTRPQTYFDATTGPKMHLVHGSIFQLPSPNIFYDTKCVILPGLDAPDPTSEQLAMITMYTLHKIFNLIPV